MLVVFSLDPPPHEPDMCPYVRFLGVEVDESKFEQGCSSLDPVVPSGSHPAKKAFHEELLFSSSEDREEVRED